MRCMYVLMVLNRLYHLLCAAIDHIIGMTIGSNVSQAEETIEHIKSKDIQKCEDTEPKESILLSIHTPLVNSSSSIDSSDNNSLETLISFSTPKEPPLEAADLDVHDELIETPDATVNVTMDSVLQHSFELQRSGLDDATSYSATDLMLFASSVPHITHNPRPKSVAIPRHSTPLARKSGSSVKRHARELLLRYEPLSLSLNNLTDLMIAAWDNDPIRVRKLLNAGQTRLQADHGYTALMLAVRNRSIDVVFLLASRETRMQNDRGKTATMIAVEVCSDEMFSLLAGMESGYQDKWGTTALMHAILLGHLGMAERLSLYDVGKIDRDGRTALIMAAYCGHLRLLPNLISEIGLSGFTSLMYSATLNDTVGIERFLALAGQQDALGRSALMYAAINGHFDAVSMLVPYEACLQSNWGGSALIYAILYGYPDIVELLIPQEMELVDNFGRTVYDHAVNPMHTCIQTKNKIITLLKTFQ